MKKNKGLTLLEILLALSLAALSMIAFFYVYKLATVSREREKIVSSLLTDISRIEVAFLNYSHVRNEYPVPAQGSNNILSNTEFNTYFLKQPAPQVPETFDRTYGLNGYWLSNNTQGYFLCLRVTVSGPDDVRFLALKEIANNFPAKAYYHHENCPATTNTVNSVGQMYLTYWITRW